MKIYIAGASKEPDRVRKMMNMVAEHQYLELTLDWLAAIADEPAKDEDLSPEEREGYATRDLDAVAAADVIWLLAPKGAGKGAWIEYGYALALGAQRTTVVSGATGKFSIFSACADREFESDMEAWAWLATWADPHKAEKTISDWQTHVYNVAKANGWWEKIGNRPMTVEEIATSLCLIHSEVSEGLESIRKNEPHFFTAANGKPEGLGSELADVIIRCMDLSEKLGIDLDEMIRVKSAFNETRSHRHGGKEF